MQKQFTLAESHAARRTREMFLTDVLAGLRDDVKRLPCKYLYDRRGSELFDRICELDEYYLTRTELSIMRDHARAMAASLGPRVMMIEFGSGSSVKSRQLLDHLRDAVAYVPVDISPGPLARGLRDCSHPSADSHTIR